MPPQIRIPNVRLSIALLFIILSALNVYPAFQTVYIVVVSLGFTMFFDLIFMFTRKRAVFIPYAAIATALIIALLIDPRASWYQVALVSAVAMGTKNFLRVSGRHIFNPAGVGLFMGGIIFNRYVSWWGVSFQNIAQFSFQNIVLFFILLLPVLVSGFRLRRFYSISVFIITHTIFSIIFPFTFSIASFFSRLFDPTTIFFAIVMLPEPMTSPANPKKQVFFGLTVAILAQLLSSHAGLLPDLFISALLIANLGFLGYR